MIKHVRRSALRGVGERGREQAGEDGVQGRPPVHIGQVGDGCALAVVRKNRFVAPGQEAPFSLPQSVALAACTIIHASVLQLLPVSGVADYTLRQ
jgi:hypothetical protein